jgi:hypothetical protein
MVHQSEYELERSNPRKWIGKDEQDVHIDSWQGSGSRVAWLASTGVFLDDSRPFAERESGRR